MLSRRLRANLHSAKKLPMSRFQLVKENFSGQIFILLSLRTPLSSLSLRAEGLRAAICRFLVQQRGAFVRSAPRKT